ncbi:MAG: CoA-binding protein, partial [Syntrophales bacterium LBB04]|nr:CoA-binding protein [Syntrophales bacterium LBB04]
MDSKNLAVFGASRDPLKPGSLLIYALKETGFSGNVAGINPQGGEVHGVPLYPRLADVPFPVELAVLIIPPAAVVQSLKDCAACGVKGVVISAEGFAEAGPEGRRYQEQVREILRTSGIRAFGPNTLGIVNTETGMSTSYGADVDMLKRGSIGFAAQSGIFVGAILRYLSSSGVYISKGFGLGNKVDVDETDILEYLADDEQTRT